MELNLIRLKIVHLNLTKQTKHFLCGIMLVICILRFFQKTFALFNFVGSCLNAHVSCFDVALVIAC